MSITRRKLPSASATGSMPRIPNSDIRKGWWNGNIGKSAKEWKYGANINYNQFKFQWADQSPIRETTYSCVLRKRT